MTKQRSLFDVTPERAAEIMRRYGFVPAGEQERAEREKRRIELLDREPIPFEPTPPELKIERQQNLARRLLESVSSGFYSNLK